ncbi:MAG: type II toxin-antitoxin system YafQ family toxin [bacterium]
MYKITWSKRFKKQFQKISKNPLFKRDIFEAIVNSLAHGKELDIKYHDHGLKGDLSGYRECHIQPDVLLVYRKENKMMLIVFVKIGSHSDLFR